MVFTDPPYNVPIDGHVSGLGRIRHREFAMASGEMSEAEFTKFLEGVFGCLVDHSVDGEAMATLIEQSTRASIGVDEFDARLSALAARYFDGPATASDDDSDIGAVLGELAIDAADLVTVPLGAHAAFPWPDLARTFEPEGATSYWWSHRQSMPSPGGFTHRGTLTPALFVMLFGERAAEARTREAAR
jgi:hypothetical protein